MTIHSKPSIPTADETILSMEKSLWAFLIHAIQDKNSPLSRVFDGSKTFSSKQELQAHLQSALADTWEMLQGGMQELWFPSNPSLYRGYGKSEFQEYLRRFTEGMYQILEPAIERRQGRLVLDLDHPDSIDKISQWLLSYVNNTEHGSPLALGQENTLEQASLVHLRSSLNILPAELRAHIGQEWYNTPISSEHQIYRESPAMKVAKTWLMTTTILFMTYGIHWLINTWVTKLAESQPDQLNNIWSTLLQSPGLYGTTSYGLSIAAAYGVATALLMPAQKIRENLIRASESGQKRWALQAVWSSGAAALALSVPILFGVIDAAGIFNREAEWYIVWHVAYQTKEKLENILDIKDPASPIGKAWWQYDTTTNTLTTFSRDFVAAEANRPWASGQWPAYKAKEFILTGDAVLDDPILSRDTWLSAAVKKASDGLNTINRQNHAEYPWLPDKAKRVQEFFWNRTDTLVNGYNDTNTGIDFKGIASFDPMIEMNKHGPLYHFIGQIPGIGGGIYKSHDLALKQWEFSQEASEFISAIEAVNKSWWDRSRVYQTYIQEVSDIADAKYNSRTSVTIPGSIPVPDLSGLTEALSQKPPKISALWPTASYEELQKIKDQPGGISSWDFNTLVAFSLIRPFALEFTSLALIIASLFSMAQFYRNPKNKLSGKKSQLDQAYNSLVRAVHKTFSWETWQAIFPGHPGIDEFEAEYIVREIATDMHPELLEFFPTAKRDLSWVKKTMHKWLTFLKNTHQGNTRSRDESYVINLAQALEKMGHKSGNNIGISTQTIARIFERIVPKEHTQAYTLTPEVLGLVTHEIQATLTALTIEKDASYAVESWKHSKLYNTKITAMRPRLESLEWDIIPKLQVSIVSGWLSEPDKVIFAQLVSEIQDIRVTYEQLLKNEHPTGREISAMEDRIEKVLQNIGKYKIKP